MGARHAVALQRTLEHRAGRLDRDEGVDERREPDGDVARAGPQLQHAARAWAEKRVENGEGLRRIWRPVSVRGRDLLVAELSRVAGREVRRLGSTRLTHRAAVHAITRTHAHFVEEYGDRR